MDPPIETCREASGTGGADPTHPIAVAAALPGTHGATSKGAGVCLLFCMCFPHCSTKPVCSGRKQVPVPWDPSTGSWVSHSSTSSSSTIHLSYSCPIKCVEAKLCRPIWYENYRALVLSHSSMWSGVFLWKTFSFLIQKCHLLRNKAICGGKKKRKK